MKIFALKVFWKIFRIFLPEKSVFKTFSYEFFSNSYLKNLSFTQIVWCYINGFLPKEYFAFDLARNKPDKYLSRLNNIRRATINGEYSDLIGDKILFEKHIKTVIQGIENLDVIENVGYIDNGCFKSLKRDIESEKFSSLRTLLDKKDLILKPVSGSRGIGVLLLQKAEDHYLLDHKRYSWTQLESFLSTLNNYLIQERFIQVGFSHDIYPESLNCLRICTMMDPQTNEPFIPYALHRFGSCDSGYTDNSSRGGISAVICPDGRLEKGRTLNKDGVIEVYESHPLTNKPIYNEKIPNWEQISASLLEMVRRMPYLKNIGWDVVLSDNKAYILEGNIGPGVNIIQVHKPMIEIPRAWEFFQHHGFFKTSKQWSILKN